MSQNTTVALEIVPVIDEDALIDVVNEWITGCQFSFVLLIFSSLLFFVIYTKLCHYVLSRFCIVRQNYNSLDDVKQRKIIVYLCSIIIRGPAAFFLIYMSFKYWTLKDGFYINDCFGIQLIQVLSVEYSTLMIFELIKLPELSWDMWIHHMIIITLACTLMDPSILDLPFRTDPYYVEITIALVIGGSIMFIYQLFWVYFHLLQFDKPTISLLRKLDTVTLKEIEIMHQTSIDNMLFKYQTDSKFLHNKTSTHGGNSVMDNNINNNGNNDNNTRSIEIEIDQALDNGFGKKKGSKDRLTLSFFIFEFLYIIHFYIHFEFYLYYLIFLLYYVHRFLVKKKVVKIDLKQ